MPHGLIKCEVEKLQQLPGCCNSGIGVVETNIKSQIVCGHGREESGKGIVFTVILI